MRAVSYRGPSRHALFPGATAAILSVVNRRLPSSGDGSTERARGQASSSVLSPSWLTVLGERAAKKYNQTA
jgi:hypothetical protein